MESTDQPPVDIDPVFDESALENLDAGELIALKEHMDDEHPLRRRFAEADYEYVLEEIFQRFKRRVAADD